MNARMGMKLISLLTIVSLLLGGSFPGSVRRAAAEWPPYRLEVHPQYDLVYAMGWNTGDGLTMDILDAGGQPLQSLQVIVGAYPWDPNLPAGDFSQAGFDFQPGQTLSVSGAGGERTFTIPDPKVSEINSAEDILRGTGTPGARIQVGLSSNDFCRWTTVDGEGNWLVDFTVPSDPGDTEGAYDLAPGSGGWVSENNDFGDATWADDWSVPVLPPPGNPTILLFPVDHFAYGRDWPMYTDLTLSIGEISLTSQSSPSAWDGTSYAYFDLAGIDLAPQTVVRISGAGITKELAISNLQLSGIDIPGGLFSGTASPYGSVTVSSDQPGGYTATTTAGDDGSWSAVPVNGLIQSSSSQVIPVGSLNLMRMGMEHACSGIFPTRRSSLTQATIGCMGRTGR
jgi:hypothetical protein